MKRLILLTAALTCATLASAQLYKYVDKDGKTVYSDQPPPGQDSKQINLPTSAPSAPQKTAVEKDKELQKGRKEAGDSAKKSEQTAKAAADAEARCNAARENVKVYERGGRLQKRDASGERVYMDEKEIEAETAKARAAVDEACKKS